jgi:hypothetical protein
MEPVTLQLQLHPAPCQPRALRQLLLRSLPALRRPRRRRHLARQWPGTDSVVERRLRDAMFASPGQRARRTGTTTASALEVFCR